MTKDKWIWMPHAGHFICGHRCQFKLSTYVGKYIVSTVGELPAYSGLGESKWEEIGIGRTYETMVFKATKSEYRCCPFTMVSAVEVDFDGYITPEDAYKGHLKMCRKWSKKD